MAVTVIITTALQKAEKLLIWQHTCAHFSKKLVHYRAFSKYTFARILFPGKRYDCAHCILLILLLAKFPPALWADSDISARRTTNGCDSLNL